jgi:hypothetical protein
VAAEVEAVEAANPETREEVAVALMLVKAAALRQAMAVRPPAEEVAAM